MTPSPARVARRHQAAIPLPPVRQETGWTCGAAALRAVLSLHGVELDEAALADAIGTNPDQGSSPEAMAATAVLLGMDASVERLDLGSLRELLTSEPPAILNLQAWGEGHFAVAVSAERCGFTLADPYSGRRVALTPAELEARWHGDDGRDHLAVVVRP